MYSTLAHAYFMLCHDLVVMIARNDLDIAEHDDLVRITDMQQSTRSDDTISQAPHNIYTHDTGQHYVPSRRCAMRSIVRVDLSWLSAF